MATARELSGVDAPCGVRLGDEPRVAGGRSLALCQGVDLIVVNQVGDVVIPPHGVEEVVSAFSVAIAVASHRDDCQLGVGDLGPGGGGEGAAVQHVQHVASGVVRQLPGLADAGDHQHLVGFKVQLHKGLLQCVEDTEIPAARAPGRLASSVVGHLHHDQATSFLSCPKM